MLTLPSKEDPKITHIRYPYIYIYIYIYIHTLTHTHTHTHTHIYTHTHTCMCHTVSLSPCTFQRNHPHNVPIHTYTHTRAHTHKHAFMCHAHSHLVPLEEDSDITHIRYLYIRACIHVTRSFTCTIPFSEAPKLPTQCTFVTCMYACTYTLTHTCTNFQSAPKLHTPGADIGTHMHVTHTLSPTQSTGPYVCMHVYKHTHQDPFSSPRIHQYKPAHFQTDAYTCMHTKYRSH